MRKPSSAGWSTCGQCVSRQRSFPRGRPCIGQRSCIPGPGTVLMRRNTGHRLSGRLCPEVYLSVRAGGNPDARLHGFGFTRFSTVPAAGGGKTARSGGITAPDDRTVRIRLPANQRSKKHQSHRGLVFLYGSVLGIEMGAFVLDDTLPVQSVGIAIGMAFAIHIDFVVKGLVLTVGFHCFHAGGQFYRKQR